MASPNPLSSTTNLFRRLTWQSSIPLEIRLAEGEPGAATGADVYYVSPSLQSPHQQTLAHARADARAAIHLPPPPHPRDTREPGGPRAR